MTQGFTTQSASSKTVQLAVVAAAILGGLVLVRIASGRTFTTH